MKMFNLMGHYITHSLMNMQAWATKVDEYLLY